MAFKYKKETTILISGKNFWSHFMNNLDYVVKSLLSAGESPFGHPGNKRINTEAFQAFAFRNLIKHLNFLQMVIMENWFRLLKFLI